MYDLCVKAIFFYFACDINISHLVSAGPRLGVSLMSFLHKQCFSYHPTFLVLDGGVMVLPSVRVHVLSLIHAAFTSITTFAAHSHFLCCRLLYVTGPANILFRHLGWVGVFCIRSQDCLEICRISIFLFLLHPGTRQYWIRILMELQKFIKQRHQNIPT
jgi:hypothetical protein